MQEISTFSTRIYPTKNQIVYFRKAFGVRRFCWNWALETYKNNLNNPNSKKKYLSNFDLNKLLNNEIKKGKFEWMNEVNSMVRQEALEDLNLAFEKYYSGINNAKKNLSYKLEINPPKFKSKKFSTNSFRIYAKNKQVFKYSKNKKFSLLTVGRKNNRLLIRTSESINFINSRNCKVIQVTIKEYPINIFTLFITYERTNHKVNKLNESSKIGIDMGIKTPLTCWDGENSYKLNPLDRIKKAEKKREKYNKKLSKKLDSYKKQQKKKAYNKGFKYRESKRYLKLKYKLQKAYQREECIKKDFREKTTTWLVTNYHTINIEPFTNGFKNSRRAVARISQYLFYERLKQKANVYNTIINWISWEPTTQTCSSCGHRFISDEKLSLNNRKYICPNCNLTLDRDINAAINIYNLK